MRTIVLCVIFLSLLMHSNAFCLLEDGMRAPEFFITSGDDKNISLNQLKGSVITIFYETKEKEIIEQNRELKNELNQFYKDQPDSIKKQVSRLAVINCSGAVWPFKGIWAKNLIKNSLKEGITIYGDWDGSFFEKYKIIKGESNCIIIDKRGIVRYSKAGKIEQAEFFAIKELLKKLLLESA
ncbi:MAG: hypothetical protein ACLQF0_07435 [Dissulfurispiraceae bacterium]